MNTNITKKQVAIVTGALSGMGLGITVLFVPRHVKAHRLLIDAQNNIAPFMLIEKLPSTYTLASLLLNTSKLKRLII